MASRSKLESFEIEAKLTCKKQQWVSENDARFVTEAAWSLICDWVLEHKNLKRLAVSGFFLCRAQVKQLKSSLNRTKAPILEVVCLNCQFDQPETLRGLQEFIKDHYADKTVYWRKKRYEVSYQSLELLPDHHHDTKRAEKQTGLPTEIKDTINLKITECEHHYQQLTAMFHKKLINPNLRCLVLTSNTRLTHEQTHDLQQLVDAVASCGTSLRKLELSFRYVHLSFESLHKLVQLQ